MAEAAVEVAQRLEREAASRRAAIEAERRALWARIQAASPALAAFMTEVRREFGPVTWTRVEVRGEVVIRER